MTGNRSDQVQFAGMSDKVVWQLLQQYALAVGLAGIAPHDLRRTCAKLCRAAGGELEQIQLLLTISQCRQRSVNVGTGQDLIHAPNDGIKLRVPCRAMVGCVANRAIFGFRSLVYCPETPVNKAFGLKRNLAIL